MTSVDSKTAESKGDAHSLRDFRLLLTAFMVSITGDWLYKLALPLLILKLTGSALQTALIYSLEYVPYLIFAPFAGVISDRHDRRLLMVRADSAAACVVGIVAVLAWFNQYHLWLIYPAAFMLSTITPLYQATFLGMLPNTVPRERLSWANSRLQAGQGTLDLTGPLLGASAVVFLGTRGALTVDSVSFALSALAVALMARTLTQRERDPAASVIGDLKEAAKFIRSSPALLWGAVVASGSSFGLAMVEANMITYLVHFRHQPVAAVGVVFAALGLGSLLGALLTPRILSRFNPGTVIICCVIIGGSATALLAVQHEFVTIAATWILVGASTAGFIVTFYTMRHQIVPERLLGRVVILTRVVAYMMVPIAPIIGGALLSDTNKFWPVIAVSSAAQIGVGLAALCTPFRKAAAAAQLSPEAA